jgi:hypothetical protein
MDEDDEKPVEGKMLDAGGAHALTQSDHVSYEEALRRSLELRKRGREINADYYEAMAKRKTMGRVRKFGRRR